MMPKKEKSKEMLICPRCNFKAKECGDGKIVEKLKAGKPVEVVKEDKEAMPLVEAECPKCKHTQAYWWEVQTRAADEPATQFFKCEKCKHTWRKYD